MTNTADHLAREHYRQHHAKRSSKNPLLRAALDARTASVNAVTRAENAEKLAADAVAQISREIQTARGKLTLAEGLASLTAEHAEQQRERHRQVVNLFAEVEAGDNPADAAETEDG